MLVLIFALTAPLPSTAQAFEDMFGLMFRMMLTMMNVMSGVMLGNDNNSWGNNFGGLNSFNLGMSAMPMMSGFASPFNSFGSSPWSMSPWDRGWGNPFGSGYPGGFSPPFGGGYPDNRAGYGPGAAPYAPASIIEGRWYGSSGEIFEVQGRRFRLRSGRFGLDGAISVENDIINMYSPRTNTVSRYTFVRNQSGLLMQGMNGELLRFTRYPPNRAMRMF